jgi:hypothetical protein
MLLVWLTIAAAVLWVIGSWLERKERRAVALQKTNQPTDQSAPPLATLNIETVRSDEIAEQWGPSAARWVPRR